eukprot:8677861-Alexandrium_andersonii.AAC.1
MRARSAAQHVAQVDPLAPGCWSVRDLRRCLSKYGIDVGVSAWSRTPPHPTLEPPLSGFIGPPYSSLPRTWNLR